MDTNKASGNSIELQSIVEMHFTKSDDDLFQLLGTEVEPGDQGMGHSPEGKREQGRQYFLSQYREIQRRICTNERVIKLRDSDTADIGLTTLVASVIFDPYGAVTAGLAAILVTRRGLQNFCAGFNE